MEKWNNAKHVSRALNCSRSSFVVCRSSFVVEAALVGWEAMRWIHVSEPDGVFLVVERFFTPLRFDIYFHIRETRILESSLGSDRRAAATMSSTHNTKHHRHDNIHHTTDLAADTSSRSNGRTLEFHTPAHATEPSDTVLHTNKLRNGG